MILTNDKDDNRDLDNGDYAKLFELRGCLSVFAAEGHKSSQKSTLLFQLFSKKSLKSL
jgi:hypothetical protein